MKSVGVLIIGFLILGTEAASANSDCTYTAVGKDGYRLRLRISKGMEIVDQIMKHKGFTKNFDDATARYRVDFWTDIATGEWNGLDHPLVGDNCAKASITRIEDKKVIYEERADGMSGLVWGIAKKEKSKYLLKKILKNFPDCSQL